MKQLITCSPLLSNLSFSYFSAEQIVELLSNRDINASKVVSLKFSEVKLTKGLSKAISKFNGLEELTFSNVTVKSKQVIQNIKAITEKANKLRTLGFTMSSDDKELKDLSKIDKPLRYLKVL